MASEAKRNEVNELKGEIELKASVVKSEQEIFANQLTSGLGESMMMVLTTKKKPETFWQRIKRNLKKITF